jgi:DNA-binding CsgD family transcriptional regulator
VSVDVVSRSTELRSIAQFFAAVQDQPSGLLLEGAAGIGKTTLWLAALKQARRQGFHVLSARAWEAESVLAYGTVADLMADIDASVLAALPDIQRVAVDRVLLRGAAGGPATNQHVVAAALLSIIETLAVDAPVIVAIDDLQWLDASSQTVVSYVVRRLRGRAGFIGSERTEPGRGSVTSWLQLARPDAVDRIHVDALSLGGLHELLRHRLGRSFSRPTMVQIAEVSGGNPFYALELARTFGSGPDLPRTLSDVVRKHVADLDKDTDDALLAAACIAAPTVDMLARVVGTTAESMVARLEEVEARGVIEINGNRVHYAHPLLARGVYVGASPARRRRMHRALADIADQPELRARHLALATSRKDPEILQALDDASYAALARGAPAAAAELLDLAIKLGGDTPSRRMNSAGQHFRAGDTDQAHAVLAPALEQMPPGAARALALNLLAGIWIYRRSFAAAAEALEDAVKDATGSPGVLAQTLLMLSFAQANTGDYAAALRNSEQAVKYAEELGIDVLTSQALADWQILSALCGNGFDENSLRRAVVLQNPDIDVPIPLTGDSAAAQVLAWAGRLDEAYEHIQVLRRRCIDRGADSDLLFVAVWDALINIWRGNFAEAGRTAIDAMERAEQMGGDHSLVIALTVRGLAAAYAGRVDQARADAHAAIEAATRFSAPLLAEWPIMTLGFVSVSLGDHEQALADLAPLIDGFDRLTCTEIIKAGFVPDAVEAMVATARGAEALPMVEALERNGARLDRSWMLAMAARCRAMLLAAQGDVEAAERSARQSLAEHDRLTMPFERARTLLLLGQLQRRQRQKQSAAATLGEALNAFEGLGAPLWVQRARAEVDRTTAARDRDNTLTASEQRVAELAASGMSNRDIAAALFISAKTVEANLTQIYRKLGIRSRAELGRIMGQGQ